MWPDTVTLTLLLWAFLRTLWTGLLLDLQSDVVKVLPLGGHPLDKLMRVQKGAQNDSKEQKIRKSFASFRANNLEPRRKSSPGDEPNLLGRSL